MMCVAVFFLPCSIIRVTNFSITGLLYRGSRTTFFFRISCPLGIVIPLLRLRPLGAVLRPGLLAVLHPEGVLGAADDV